MSKDSNGISQATAARVGKYLMLDMLGEGAFGKVRLAVDETDGHQYAMKIMEKSHIKANELTLQVRREIAVMKAMRHPNIVNLHEVLNSSKNLYMVMDLVTGGELFDAVAEAGKLPEARARLYFQQIVDGIHYCHTRRVYHRDLKPENLLLSDDKQMIKITDFGLSSIKTSNASTELLHTIMGSPHYIAPEIITSAAAGYDGAKVDVWASGIILFGMLAGFLPFDEPQMSELYRSIVRKNPSYPPHFSYDVIKLLRAMLQKDPSKRPTMEEVKQFTWFKVNYYAALAEDQKNREHSGPITAPRKGKLRTRAKKTATDKQSRRKKEVDGTNHNGHKHAEVPNNSALSSPPPPRPVSVPDEAADDKHNHHTAHQSETTGIVEGSEFRTLSRRSCADSEGSEYRSDYKDHFEGEFKSCESMAKGELLSHLQINVSDGSKALHGTNDSSSVSDNGNQNHQPHCSSSSHESPKRPPMLQSADVNNMPGESCNDPGFVPITPAAMYKKNSASYNNDFNVNSVDVSNAFVTVETPIPVSQLIPKQRIRQQPFTSATKSTPFKPCCDIDNVTIPTTSSTVPLDNSGSGIGTGISNMKHPNQSTRQTEGRRNSLMYGNNSQGLMSTGSSMCSRNGNMPGTSSFRDGVKRVLETGIEALVSSGSKTSAKIKGHGSEVKKLSFHTLFSQNRPAEIPLQPGLSRPVESMSATDDSFNTTPLRVTQAPLRAPQAPPRVPPAPPRAPPAPPRAPPAPPRAPPAPPRAPPAPPRAPPALPHPSAAIEPDASSGNKVEEEKLDSKIGDEQNEFFISPISEMSDKTFEQGLETPSSANKPPCMNQTDISTRCNSEGHKCDDDCENNGDDDTGKTGKLINFSSPVTCTAAATSSPNEKTSIFKPARSVFMPLAKTLFPPGEEDAITCATRIFQPLAASNNVNVSSSSLEGLNKDNGCNDDFNGMIHRTENMGIMSSEWGLDSGEVFADVETDGKATKWVQPRVSCRKTGALKFINDLRRAQSPASKVDDLNSGERGGQQQQQREDGQMNYADAE